MTTTRTRHVHFDVPQIAADINRYLVLRPILTPSFRLITLHAAYVILKPIYSSQKLVDSLSLTKIIHTIVTKTEIYEFD